MKFTRKELKRIFSEAEIEVPKDVLTQICDLHTSANDDLVEEHKEEIEQLKTELEDNGEVVKKDDYEKVKEELDHLKEDIANKETRQAKEHAIRELYKAIGISEKRIDTVMKVTDLKGIELDKEGNIKDVDTLKKTASEEWADFIETSGVKGTDTPNPPKKDESPDKDLGSLSMADYIKARKGQ